MSAEKVIRHVARLYELRDTARMLFGDDWPRVRDECQQVIRLVMRMRGCGAIQAVIELADKANDERHDGVTLQLFGAAVEMIEEGGEALMESKRLDVSVGSCRSCGADILWVKTVAGKRMPLNRPPDPTGNLVMQDLETCRAATPDDPPSLVRWKSHFSTCPRAAAHRRGGVR